MRTVLLIALSLGHALASAAIPDEYNPVVVEVPFSFSERVIDLSPATAKAKKEDKALYIYLGASDCPPCKLYFHFLKSNRETLKPGFDKVVLVDIRTWLKGPTLIFKVDDKRYTFDEFKALVGDSNKLLTYPYYWYVTPSLRQLKQLPQGSAYYLSVEKQLEILRAP
jgi:thiol-disulfide isomerase/thioredoxin